ncbi:MAG TPA: SDR family oxidoreductase [Bryobacteraceae bacterium]|nr:SDR family oxidoreductase [Bryobacteraceae bacterium]
MLAGGAGGLGRAAAEMLAAEGARVIVSYRSRAIDSAVKADLSDADDRRRLLDTAPALYGLVVFAGEAARSEELLEQSLASNFVGPIRLAREAAERMKAANTPGAIVLIATMQATAVFAGSTAYAAPKAALLHAGRILAKEMRGPANIRVNVVCPGVNDAGMARASIASGKYDRFLSEGVIPRWGRAEDVARAVRFFLEPDSYVTGQVLTVDGGLTL